MENQDDGLTHLDFGRLSLITIGIDRYIAEYGIEAAKGYVQAYAELFENIEHIIYPPHNPGVPNSNAIVKREIGRFYERHSHVINSLKKIKME